MAVMGRGFASNTGDQGALYPITSRQVMKITTQITPNTAQGLFTGLLSPLLERNGSASIDKTIKGGARKITQDSMAGGISANSAKKGIIYQSGAGVVFIYAGSGAVFNNGGPITTASPTTER